MAQQPPKQKCLCGTLDWSLYEGQMPEAVSSNLAKLLETGWGAFFGRCPDCGQYWKFFFYGRNDIPTFEKLDEESAKKQIAAWHEAKPEFDARDARWAEEARQRAAEFAIEQVKYRKAEARAKEPLAIFLQYVAIMLIVASGLLGCKMMIEGGDPSPHSLAIASAVFLFGLVMAGCHAWLTRIR